MEFAPNGTEIGFLEHIYWYCQRFDFAQNWYGICTKWDRNWFLRAYILILSKIWLCTKLVWNLHQMGPKLVSMSVYTDAVKDLILHKIGLEFAPNGTEICFLEHIYWCCQRFDFAQNWYGICTKWDQNWFLRAYILMLSNIKYIYGYYPKEK